MQANFIIMNNDFNNYPEDSMVWVYQSDHFFTASEKEAIQNKVSNFLQKWDSHGHPVKGSYAIIEDAFIVIAADGQGTQLCGRAQSASIFMITELEQELGIKLLDRTNQTYKSNGTIKFVALNDFKSLYQQGAINEDTLVFDNTVINKKDFDNKWQVALKDSWHKRFV